MTNTFAQWQPIYAAAGIALLPASGKAPLVRNPARFGIPASTTLAARHAAAGQFGFICGAHSGITILDIDAADESLLEQVLARYGDSPIIVRTPSGGFHVWYRYSGEQRRIRLDGQPLDLLGNGFVMAPPTRTEKGAYTFIKGSLDDRAALPKIAPGALRIASPAPPARRGLAALLVPPVTSVGEVSEGGRNDALFRHCLQLAPTCRDLAELQARADAYNHTTLRPPLHVSEMTKTTASAWRMQAEGRNWAGGEQRAAISFRHIDGLMLTHPDAFLLLAKLIRTHRGLRDTFCVANAMAPTMSARGWGVKRLARARKALLDAGELVPAKARGRARSYRFAG